MELSNEDKAIIMMAETLETSIINIHHELKVNPELFSHFEKCVQFLNILDNELYIFIKNNGGEK